jgi:hypothetical protein
MRKGASSRSYLSISMGGIAISLSIQRIRASYKEAFSRDRSGISVESVAVRYRMPVDTRSPKRYSSLGQNVVK